MSYFGKISLYLIEFIIPGTGISLPVLLKVKQPQNIVLESFSVLAQHDHSEGFLLTY